MILKFFRLHAVAFRARSAERDRQSDLTNVERIAKAIEQAIANCRTEHDGLSKRLADVTSRAVMVAGNGSDDYHEREHAESDRLSELDTEVKNAQQRLDQLTLNISQFEFLREELRVRFAGDEGPEAHTMTAYESQRSVALS